MNEFAATDAVRVVITKNLWERPGTFEQADHRTVACLRVTQSVIALVVLPQSVASPHSARASYHAELH